MGKFSVLFGIMFTTLFFWGCNCEYDDSSLVGRVENLEDRVTALEEFCQRVNGEIVSLRALVEAVQSGDFITEIAPVIEKGETIGYMIGFEKHDPVTIYHGQAGSPGVDGEDGKDGIVPEIGVCRDSDGIYYWTLGGEWMVDGNGDKIKAEGTDGQDGVDGMDGCVPQLKIEGGFWWVSYDDEVSWTQLGRATGEKGDKGDKGEPGEKGGDSIFKDVVDKDDCVEFVLQDGTTIVIRKTPFSEEILDISFSISDSVNVLPNKSYGIGYTISGGDENTTIDVVAQNGYRANIVKSDFRSGKIVVTTPDPAPDDRIIVFVSDGAEKTVMRFINFAESVILVADSNIEVAAEGETISVEVETNVMYEVVIPEKDQSWISVADTRAATHSETLTFSVKPNPNTTYRYATVTLNDASGLVAQSIVFAQKASGYKMVYVETAGTLESHISADEKEKLIGLKITGTLNVFDYDFMRTMPALKTVDIAQITNTTIPPSCFKGAKIETIVLPLRLTAIPDNAFNGSSITSISIPDSVTAIGASAFQDCKALAGSIVFPEGLLSIGKYAFYRCEKLSGDLIIPNSVLSIGDHVFCSCYGLNGKLTLSNELKFIPKYAFAFCENLSGYVNVPDKVTSIDEYAFCGCTGIREYISIGKSVTSIGKDAFSDGNGGSVRYRKIYCRATIAPRLDAEAFGRTTARIEYLGIPAGCRDAYDFSWTKHFNTIEEVEF